MPVYQPVHKRDWQIYISALAISDLACLLTAFIAAAWLASRPSLGAHTGDYYGIFTVLMLPVFTIVFVAQGLYDAHNLLGGTREYASILRASIYGLVALILLSYAVHRHISREWIVFSGALAISFVSSARFMLRRLAIWFRRRGHFTARALMVGADADSIAMARHFSAPGSGIQIVGFLDDYAATGSTITSGLKVLGSPTALLEMAARTKAEEAVVVPQALPWETLQTLMRKATAASSNGLQVHLSAGFYDLLTTGVRLSERNHVPLLTVNKARLTPFETAFKRSLDWLLGTVLLLFFSPAMMFLALRLRLHGSGPVLERFRVRGRFGKPFDQLSFRTSPVVRSTLLRKLPGLLNVLAGQLSLVGPRPISEESPSAVEHLPLAIRPGLTGPWREADDPREQALLDLYYIRSYSIWLDVQVLFRRLRSRFATAFRWGRVAMFIGTGLAVVAFLIRLQQAQGQGLWLDESTSLMAALEPTPQQALISATLHEVGHPPLYNLLLWGWIHLFSSVDGARLLSVVAGTAAVALAMALAWIFWGRGAGLVAGVLGALSPWQVYYSNEIRVYAIESALGIVSLIALWRAASRGRRLDWAIYSLSAIAFGWSDLVAAFALLGQGLWMIVRLKQTGGKQQRRRAAISYAAILASLTAVAPYAAIAAIRGTGSGARSDPLRFLTLLADLGAGLTAPSWAQLLGAVSVLAVAALLVVFARSDDRFACLALYSATPIALMFVIGLLSPNWTERTMLFLAPSVWVAASGLFVTASRRTNTIAVLCVLLLALSGTAGILSQVKNPLRAYYRLPTPEAYSFVADEEARGERFLDVDSMIAVPFAVRDRLANRTVLLWELSAQRHPGVDVTKRRGLPGWINELGLRLDTSLSWDPGARRISFNDIARWCRQAPDFWLVYLDQPGYTVIPPLARIDLRLATGDHAPKISPVNIERLVPTEYAKDRVVEIGGTMMIHFRRIAQAAPSSDAA